LQVSERAEPAAEELAKGFNKAAKEIADAAVPVGEDATAQISQAARTVKEQAPKKAEELSKAANDKAKEIAKQAKPTADKAAKQVHVCLLFQPPPSPWALGRPFLFSLAATCSGCLYQIIDQ